MKPKQEDPKEMVGGCCVCSDENGWAENPLVYCDGQGCNVAVHQACYGIVTVPTGAWFCRKCESQERAARVRCELCPSKDGALKRTDSGGWAHVVCALYIPEVRFGNVTTMEPIMLQLIPQERFNKSCYLCDEAQRGSKATIGACMQCNRAGCKNHFHVTCAQAMGLLCEEAGNYLDNVKYCGYCQYHYNKLLPNFQRRGSHVKTIPPYRPVPHDGLSSDEDKTSPNSNNSDSKDLKLKKRSSNKTSPVHDSTKQLTREVKVNLGDLSGPSKSSTSLSSTISENAQEQSVNLNFSVSLVQNSGGLTVKPEADDNQQQQHQSNFSNTSNMNTNSSSTPATSSSSSNLGNSKQQQSSPSDSKTNNNTVSSLTFLSSTSLSLTSSNLPSSSSASVSTSESVIVTSGMLTVVTPASSSCTSSGSPLTTSTDCSSTIVSSGGNSTVSTIVSLPSKIKLSSTGASSASTTSTSHSQPSLSISLSSSGFEKDKRKGRRSNNSNSSSRMSNLVIDELSNESESGSKDGGGGNLIICEERNLSVDREKSFGSGKGNLSGSPEEAKLNVQFTPNVSTQVRKQQQHQQDNYNSLNSDSLLGEPLKRSRSNSQDKGGRRSKRGGGGGSGGGQSNKRGRMKDQGGRGGADSGASSPDSDNGHQAPPMKRGRIPKLEPGNTTKESLSSVITNGVSGLSANTLLLGNQINPASAVAQKMADTLHAELEAHSIYKEEEKVNTTLVGPALPGKRETSTPGSSSNSTQPPPLPQSLEQLLERQWEQGSQFLMEQAQHFDIASLLSCLHQLRQENVRLEETVNNLISRRDHLLAVNARLSVPLGANGATTVSSSATGGGGSSATSSVGGSLLSSSTSSSTSGTLCISSSGSLVSAAQVAPSPVSLSGGLGTQLAQQISTGSGAVVSSPAILTSSHRGHAPQQRHPSGGSSHQSLSNSSSGSSVGGRGASPHDRRNPHQTSPIENGLGEPEYRYRSPGADNHRQQSPMLPPGAQPSPNTMRQSPAGAVSSSSYHSGSSPHHHTHVGVPSLSPSGGGVANHHHHHHHSSHPPPPPHHHTLVAHVPSHGGGAPTHSSSTIMPTTSSASSAVHHGGVALSRVGPPSEHSRAELVRLTASNPSPQAHSSPAPNVGYPTVYQMVSPPVPGPHHSPVGSAMSQQQQHNPHSQVLRREVVDSTRNSHSLEKR